MRGSVCVCVCEFDDGGGGDGVGGECNGPKRCRGVHLTAFGRLVTSHRVVHAAPKRKQKIHRTPLPPPSHTHTAPLLPPYPTYTFPLPPTLPRLQPPPYPIPLPRASRGSLPLFPSPFPRPLLHYVIFFRTLSLPPPHPITTSSTHTHTSLRNGG